MVSIGQKAPSFALYDDSRQLFRLNDLSGKRVVLLFFPGAFTSVCTTELNTVNNDLDAYRQANAVVVGISTDSPFVLAEFRRVHGFQFSLLSDHDAEVSALYGVRYDHDFTDMRLDRISRRSAFVIDEEGIVRHVQVMEHAGLQPDFDAIKEALSA